MASYKYPLYDSHAFPFYTTQGGIDSHGSVTITNVVRVYADWSRPKPSPLNDTSFNFRREWFNTEHVDHIGNQPPARQYTGPAYWSYPFVGVTTTRSVAAPPASAGIQAAMRAANKLADSPLDLGESLFELRETASMVSKRARQLASAAWNLKRRRFKEVFDSLKHSPSRKQLARASSLPKGKELANGWLELQYGWMPLVNDAYGAVDAYHKGLSSRGQTVKSRSGRGGLNSGGSQQIQQRLNSIQTPEDLAEYASAHISGNIWNSNLANLNAFGLVNPALVAWNLLPVSFVVDWFVPISGILGAMTYDAGFRNLRGSYTLPTYLSIQSNSAVGGPISSIFTTSRYPYLPTVGDIARNLPFAASLNISQLITSVALLRQSFGR